MKSRPHYYLDWLFKDLNGRRGKYIIAEVPNLPLVIFMISIVLGVVLYPGLAQTFFIVVAYVSLAYWSVREWRGGRSRFRQLLGILGVISVIAAVLLRLGL